MLGFFYRRSTTENGQLLVMELTSLFCLAGLRIVEEEFLFLITYLLRAELLDQVRIGVRNFSGRGEKFLTLSQAPEKPSIRAWACSLGSAVWCVFQIWSSR